MGSRQRKPHASAAKRWSFPRALLVATGIALVVVFVARVGTGEVRAQLLRVGPKALWLFVPYAIGTFIGAFPWGSLLPREVRPRWLSTVQSRFAASGANSILPFFGIAGEPSRLLWLPAPARACGLAAIVVDRLLYNSANGLLLLTGALVAWRYTSMPASLVSVAVVIGLLTLGVTAGVLYVIARFGIGRKVQSLLRRLLGQSYGDAGFGSQVDRALIEIVRGPTGPLLRGAGLHVLGKAAVISEVYVGLWSLGAEVGFARALVLAVVPIALSFFFASVPGQIGIQEGTQTLVASALGLNPALVLSLVLLQRFRQLAFAALLPALLAAARPKPPAKDSSLIGNRSASRGDRGQLRASDS